MLHRSITASLFLTLLLGLTLFTSSIAEAQNNAPTTVGTIPNQTVTVGGTAASVDVSSYFSDADGDTLTYTASSSDTAIATVSVSSATVTITPVAAGTATVTVTATDPSSTTATQDISVTVASANNAPTAVGTIAAQTLTAGGTAASVDVSSNFSDADGDTLTYTATSSDTTKASVSVSSATVTITPVAAGTATITVTATDPSSATATQDISVTVGPQNNAPVAEGSIPDSTAMVGGSGYDIDVSSYFSDADGDTLTYTASSSDTTKATVSVVNTTTVLATPVAAGTATITVTATDTEGATATQSYVLTAIPTNNSPHPKGTIDKLPAQTVTVGGTATLDLSSYFTDPDGDALTYTATSADTAKATVSVSSATLTITGVAGGNTTVTAVATDPGGLWSRLEGKVAVSTVSSPADVTPGLSSEELSLLGALLTYNTVIFNELHNGSDDATDWLELRNVSPIDIALENWQLTIQTGSDTAIIPFPADTVIPAGEVLLLTNTALTTSSVVVESFALPQTEFALILRSPTAFGDIAGNYFQDQKERPETAPELTADTVWERVQGTTSGYRAEAWAVSTHRNGHGSPGYHPSALAGDLNNDGIVNIQDLVLVASQFGTTGITAADLNGDNTVNMDDLLLVANAFSNIAAAPTAKQTSAAIVNNWLQLAQQNVSSNLQTALPEGFSYTRGIQVLEQLARALTPETTALLANYPNPFNPETWIPYQLAKPADVTVSIYASDGSVVRTLALGHQAAGMYTSRTHAAYWNGKNELGESVASGVYFYTLSTESTRDSVTASDFTATRKMLILK